MVSFLLIISFLLHIITLYAVFFLYKQHQTNKQNDVREITKIFEEFIQEIQEENLRLQKEIQKGQKVDIAEPHDTKENELDMNTKYKSMPLHEPYLKVDDMEDSIEASLEAKVLQLYHEGKSVTEIAKKLNCGKTEADLIIRLHKKVSK
ncbi:DUF6115 domain-containing protein [Oceanobacillus halophilus]|uniref:Uncharacterized protein n=1 Tax=Oceanobacillus halophilus TaxID=930130 RepID=A0A495AC14_9BACI|nr:hypothetical protein [Oceanobacillus halophilus]RKQ37508.1 hypothetical protein D8M06_01500 [Oceanobacillus halophilus]